MAKIHDILEQKLKDHPQFRERSLRAKFLMVLTLRDLGLEDRQKSGGGFELGELSQIAIKYASYERAWRQCLERDESLRGSDYEMKEILSQDKIIELGYLN